MITLLIPKAGFELSGPDNGMRGPIANWIGCLPILVMPEITGFKNTNVVFASQFCVISMLPPRLAPLAKLCEKKGCRNNWFTSACSVYFKRRFLFAAEII